MADYDVGALALVVPATSSPKTTYRPAVSIRNNGKHDALASGYLRIYAAGLLEFESELYSATLTPGATGQAQAVNYWTPKTEGTYTIHAYLSTPLDQVESNNMLAPVTIEITGAAPPTPPTVPAHAAQHEDGGSDEVSIDGLKGRAADAQLALAHAAQHQAGGSDTLNVGSLQGILAEDQPAQAHSNSRHNPSMATSSELTAHQGAVAVHTAATNLANRNLSGPQAGLVPLAQLALGTDEGTEDTSSRFLNLERLWVHPHRLFVTVPPSLTITPQNGESPILTLPLTPTWQNESLQLTLLAHGFLEQYASTGGALLLRLRFNGTLIEQLSIPAEATTLRYLRAEVLFDGSENLSGIATLMATLARPSPYDASIYMDSSSDLVDYSVTPAIISLTAELINSLPNTHLSILMARASSFGHQK